MRTDFLLYYRTDCSPENKDSLQDLIGQVIGKEIQVEVRPLAKEQSFERSYIDLSQIVHMEIEEE